ncbi:MAG: 5-formyltetrahydrofolate cyclo-ligase [Clostridiales bacterium]|nr:5-formyltetrahydrofolate cyclo-ligase [Clostridiales bacterium]
MSESIRQKKRALRIQMRTLRNTVVPEKQAQVGRAIVEVLLSGRLPIPPLGRGSVLAMYVSDGGEPDFMPCLPELLQKGIRCCFPAFRKGKMGFYAPAGDSDYVRGAFGIYEPGPKALAIDGGQIDVMLVPGMAFGRSGMRLGRGKGYYDRYLSRLESRKRPVTIGTGYDFQVMDTVPADASDMRMDHLVTPGLLPRSSSLSELVAVEYDHRSSSRNESNDVEI